MMSPALDLTKQLSDVYDLSPGQTPQGTGWLSHVHHPQGVKPTNETSRERTLACILLHEEQCAHYMLGTHVC